MKLISSVPPYIVATTPAAGDTNFSPWEDIILDFSRQMDNVSVETTFTIIPETSGIVRWENGRTTMKFISDSLQFETNYTITISGDAQDKYGHLVDGNIDGTGGDDFILIFKTGPADMESPVLLTAYPPKRGLNIELQPITNITFDEELDSASITEDIFNLQRSLDYSAVPGALEHYVVNNQSVLCYFPTEKLFSNESYAMKIYPGYYDIWGNIVNRLRSFIFTTSSNDYSVTNIDDFETGLTNWWAPQNSGSTKGIITEKTNVEIESNIVNLLTESTVSHQINYGWDLDVSPWLIRIYLGGGAPRDITFNNNYMMQVYVFGDGSDNSFRFAVDENVQIAGSTDHEVSPWYKIDWIGWKLITWDMTTDSTGIWGGNGGLDGTLRFDSIQLTHNLGSSATGTLYFDDLRIVKNIPVQVAKYESVTPTEFVLFQNYPNPFNPKTNIKYQLSNITDHVILEIFDLLGKKVRILVNEKQSAGEYLVLWDGKAENGNDVASGNYIYKLTAGDFIQSKQMVLIR